MSKKKPRRRPEAPPPREEEVSINVYVPKSLRDQLDRIVERAGSNLKQQIIRALRHYLPVAEKRLGEDELTPP